MWNGICCIRYIYSHQWLIKCMLGNLIDDLITPSHFLPISSSQERFSIFFWKVKREVNGEITWIVKVRSKEVKRHTLCVCFQPENNKTNHLMWLKQIELQYFEIQSYLLAKPKHRGVRRSSPRKCPVFYWLFKGMNHKIRSI